jgi:SAM-dependent methyltransferase
MAPLAEHESNRLAWNEVTPAHNSHKGDQAAFLRAGGSTLYPEEVELLGNLAGRSLLHLQCNCGQDSLSLAAQGAKVTGVDISDEAINVARALSSESGIPADFFRDDVFEFLARTDRRFDNVFASYGCLAWLKDLEPWARGIARVLQPGGRFVMVEFHPAPQVFDEDWKPANPYSSRGRGTADIGIPDYVAMGGGALVPWGYQDGIQNFEGKCEAYEFFWGLSDVFGALLAAGLTLRRFEEYPYSNGSAMFNNMTVGEGRRLYLPPEAPQLPLMYGVIFELVAPTAPSY